MKELLEALVGLVKLLALVVTLTIVVGLVVMLIVVMAEQFGLIEWGWVCDPNDTTCEVGRRNLQ